MLNPVDLGQISKPLEDQLSGLSLQGNATLFGVCGYALLPILREVEERFMRQWTFPDTERALLISREFALGDAPAQHNRELRDRLLESVPNGHELDSPWSTHATDALICIDAALVAASEDLQDFFEPSWIYYVLEPLAVSLSPNSYDLPPALLSKGGRISAAVDFLSRAISELSKVGDVSDEMYEGLLRSAVAIRPHSPNVPRS
ncbi:hypothetical protein [Planotetraspora mira]|uniref:hypothetical protein n=1 Tax=Planotetraspora mira TaxID=58121 RepID=UPI00194FCBCC|nr:hypothetical protein [Planotetraspora mira]